MKKQLSTLIAVFFVFSLLFPAIASAQQVYINLDKLPPEEAAKVLEAKKFSEGKIEKVPTTEQVESWVKIGQQIGQAIAATCKELSVEVNEFIKTPVGKITTALIVWKVVGKDLWGIVGGSLAWIIISSIILWSFQSFHMCERIKDREKGTIKYVPRYEFRSGEAKAGSVCAHVLAFAAITIACLVIVFS